jgi:ubiquinone/menaquinone biosynthesis C-methylase UbiE
MSKKQDNKNTFFYYDNHKIQRQSDAINDGKILGRPHYSNLNSLDAWRHSRMHKPVKGFIEADPNATWLTVGDGRYGTDGNFLLRSGAKSVHCTDLSDALLKIGNGDGFIQSYSEQNAEALDFESDSFDYVFCKEALHHFPRPYIALNEMFRVAKKSVILIEPRDHLLDSAIFGNILTLIRRIFGRRIDQHNFEPVGNYVYSISQREMEKFLLGMHYTCIAFTGVNDAYIPGIESIPTLPSSINDRKVKFSLLLKIWIKNILCRMGVMKSGVIIVALFKTSPTEEVRASLGRFNWVIKTLPKTPF